MLNIDEAGAECPGKLVGNRWTEAGAPLPNVRNVSGYEPNGAMPHQQRKA
jgi:hypothetical protein